jgi:hypothetical protein
MKTGKWTSIVDFVKTIKEVMNQLVGIGDIVQKGMIGHIVLNALLKNYKNSIQFTINFFDFSSNQIGKLIFLD